ncbi:MAG: elongation factor P [Myxococcales bacterium]
MGDMVDTSEFRNGLKIEIDNEPFEIVYFQHVKPGKGSAFVRTKIRSLLSGRTLEYNYKSGEKFIRAEIEEKEMQFLYVQTEDFYFMDQKTYDQTFLSKDQLGEARNFLKENLIVSILFYKGKAVAVTPPNTVELRVSKCDPGVRGDTVSGAQKPATLETGYTLQVPLFINEGDIIRVDTRSGEYLTRTATA